MKASKHFLWIDCSAGAAVGLLVTAIHPWLSGLFSLPEKLVLAMGIVNLAYASFSFSLARRKQRPKWQLLSLAIANVVWGMCCLILLAQYWHQVTWMGCLQLLGEGIFVAGLGVFEWKYREALLIRDTN